MYQRPSAARAAEERFPFIRQKSQQAECSACWRRLSKNPCFCLLKAGGSHVIQEAMNGYKLEIGVACRIIDVFPRLVAILLSSVPGVMSTTGSVPGRPLSWQSYGDSRSYSHSESMTLSIFSQKMLFRHQSLQIYYHWRTPCVFSPRFHQNAPFPLFYQKQGRWDSCLTGCLGRAISRGPGRFVIRHYFVAIMPTWSPSSMTCSSGEM